MSLPSDSRCGDGCIRLEAASVCGGGWWIGSDSTDGSSVVVTAIGGRPRQTATAMETAASDSRGGDASDWRGSCGGRWIGSNRDSSSVVVTAVVDRPRQTALETEMDASDLRGGDGCVRLERQLWRSMDRIRFDRKQCCGDGSRRQPEAHRDDD